MSNRNTPSALYVKLNTVEHTNNPPPRARADIQNTADYNF